MSDKSFSRRSKAIQYPVPQTVHLDWETRNELDIIALFERKKVGPLMRDVIIQKVQVYLRNPAYKRFKKQLEEEKEKRRMKN